MRELFKAGYMEDWTLNQTLSGVPQGGIVSPLLSNILLDKLDKYVETTLIPKYTKGTIKERNPEYSRLMGKSQHQRQKGNTEQAESLRTQAQKLPTRNLNDPPFRRLRIYLQEELRLELSQAKTLITHARTETARFLGYEITTLQNDNKRTIRNTKGMGTWTKCRSVNSRIGWQVPKDVIEEKCHRYMKGQEALHRTELLYESDYTIITTYQLEYRGIANYYRLAYNMHTLKQLKRTMEISLTKTLATKFKVSVSKIYEKYGAG